MGQALVWITAIATLGCLALLIRNTLVTEKIGETTGATPPKTD